MTALKTLGRRLDRLALATKTRPLCEMSDAELIAEIAAPPRRWLDDPEMPAELRADILWQIADIEAGAAANPEAAARDARIEAAIMRSIER